MRFMNQWGNPALTDEQKEAKLKEMNSGRRDDENNKAIGIQEHRKHGWCIPLGQYNYYLNTEIETAARESSGCILKAMKRLFI